MKKTLFAAALFLSLSAFANIRIDEKLEQQFKEAYPTATAVKWYDNKDSYEVVFEHNAIPCRIVYDTNGNMLQMRRDYKVEALPMFICGAIKKKYPEKKVFGVTEMTTQDGLTYHIVLEDDKYWTFVEATSGGALTYKKKLRKA